FLNDNADRLASVVQTGARKRLDDAIKTLDGHKTDQDGGTLTSRGLTRKQRSLRVELLRDHMSSIARIAKADLPNTPEFSALRMPAGKPTPERLAAAASGMSTVASNFPDVFISAGMPQDFIAQLNK